ncbi:calvin cycle protein CP12-1, chloroplastic-like [Hibiscus syriacus]|uniref:calvin cycle protein CP12-1, chloroplastic-like n=1 Tax=Hibiscus syriacus TaxID=106335 RepID=UPI0019211FE4|nr:calvin cycle protein CP12-1, chloroplastic-like [Hibiscus syriacus]
MATLFSFNLLTPRIAANLPDSTKVPYLNQKNQSWKRITPLGCRRMQGIKTHWTGPASDSISEKVVQGIKEAEECSGDPASGDCVAAWDEVEELSAVASHARDRMKDNDPLENYCKDNLETDECKTYDN